MSRYGNYENAIKGMKNELTINELAPYLPYGLKCHCMGEHIDDYEDVPEPCIFKMTGLLNNNRVSLTYLCEKNVFDIDEVFPLLYPISHLTKEIEVNGEKFIPMHYFYQKFGGGYASYESFVTHEMFCYSVEQSLYYTDAIKLFEWHFDVFGLIEKGLAIDKTSL